MPATTYLGNMLLDATLRGQAFTVPAALYLALHTGDPSAAGTANEVSTADWPGYVRKDLLDGGAIAAAFDAAAAKATLNANEMLWAGQDGVVSVTVSWWSIKDHATAGNTLYYGLLVEDPLDPDSTPDPKVIEPGDEFIIKADRLGVEVE